MELMTGFGLATAAGLNAYIPMLLMGLMGRFTNLVNLPTGWSWLENGWVLTIVAALLAVEIVADKIPACSTPIRGVRPTASRVSLYCSTAKTPPALQD